jgi:hypothetical protein|tara:strand:+ start:3582 stop:4205 length:624 start_codon:yes stop_codon:yes gene_type:complete
LANLFDSTNYLSFVPSELKLGDFWAWKNEDIGDDYSNSSYTLTYEFNLIDGSTAGNFTLTATADGTNYKIEVTSSTTATYTKGNYNWVANITRNSDSARIKVGEGYTDLQDNYATTTASVRSFAKQMLDAIEAVALNRASMDQSSMSIAGRSLSRMSIDELMGFRDRFNREYLQEVKQSRVKNNKGSGNNIKVRFGKTSTFNPTDLT